MSRIRTTVRSAARKVQALQARGHEARFLGPGSVVGAPAWHPAAASPHRWGVIETTATGGEAHRIWRALELVPPAPWTAEGEVLAACRAAGPEGVRATEIESERSVSELNRAFIALAHAGHIRRAETRGNRIAFVAAWRPIDADVLVTYGPEYEGSPHVAYRFEAASGAAYELDAPDGGTDTELHAAEAAALVEFLRASGLRVQVEGAPHLT